jgi:multiple sugar transport system ATP-binding protein
MSTAAAAATQAPLLEARNVSRAFKVSAGVFKASRRLAAVDGVNLTVRPGEVVGLVGASGCGKSTILRMVAGLEEITEGNIYIDSKRVNDIPPKDRDIAMVFQNYALYPHMTVYKNMAFGLKLRKYPKKEIDQRVKEAADILSISHLLERKPKNLSGGERQRVAVGRAIVRHPKVFLFDEPLSNLDAKLRVQMRMEISKLHDRLEATMLYVTHDQVEAMTMGDQVVVLNYGEIQQIADPPTLYHKPANEFVAGFIGTPPMNFIDAQIVSNGGVPRLSFETFELNVNGRMKEALSQFSGSQVRLGIRPEDILVHYRSEPRNVANRIATTVELVEPLGSNVLLYLRTQSNNFIARADGTVFPEHNSQLHVTFNMEKAHLFHPETGNSMTV